MHQKSVRKLLLRQKKGINHFSDYPETSQTTWTLSRPSGKYPGYSESFEAIQKLSTIRKISKLSGNSPGYPETSQCNFKGYAQKAV